MMRQARVGLMRCTDLATLIAWLKLPFTYSVWAFAERLIGFRRVDLRLRRPAASPGPRPPAFRASAAGCGGAPGCGGDLGLAAGRLAALFAARPIFGCQRFYLLGIQVEDHLQLIAEVVAVTDGAGVFGGLEVLSTNSGNSLSAQFSRALTW